MAGIYLHIPFCKQACHYCDFHFSTNKDSKNDLLLAMEREIFLRRDYLAGETVETIYFGGGTPSILSSEEINRLIDAITAAHPISSDTEITLEANPDDLNAAKLRDFRQTPINRFSIGIQSFFEEDLLWMNRAHTAEEARSAILRVQDAGFENITADLIYGYPLLSDEKWLANIRSLMQTSIPHISSYSMTVEPRTALAAFINKKQELPMDDEQSARQFQFLMDELGAAGFLHYEISNFAQPDHFSRHNTNYWTGAKYLGIGPSAHSFNGPTRQWNVANNPKYIDALHRDRIPMELEELTELQRLNEYLLTALRTMWGADLKRVASEFGNHRSEALLLMAKPAMERGWLSYTPDKSLCLTREGKLFADAVAGECFFDQDSSD